MDESNAQYCAQPEMMMLSFQLTRDSRSRARTMLAVTCQGGCILYRLGRCVCMRQKQKQRQYHYKEVFCSRMSAKKKQQRAEHTRDQVFSVCLPLEAEAPPVHVPNRPRGP